MKNKCNVDILLLYHNKPRELLQKAINSLIDIDNFILIVDDFSTEENHDILVDECAKLKNYKIVRTTYNMLQVGATYYGLTLLENEYVLRIDDDDPIENIPCFLESNKDLFLKDANAKNILEWLEGKLVMVSNQIFNRELFKWMYSDYKIMQKEYGYYHEDVYAICRLFLKHSDLKIGLSNIKTFYKKNQYSSSYNIQHINKKINRITILYLNCIRLGIDSKIYNNYARHLLQNVNKKG